jgi:hypothetical protein
MDLCLKHASLSHLSFFGLDVLKDRFNGGAMGWWEDMKDIGIADEP